MNLLNEAQEKWVDTIWDKLCAKLSKTSVDACGKVPYTTIDGIWNDAQNVLEVNGWTGGFWPGLMWLMYVGTGEECYKKAAEAGEERMDAVFYEPFILHHDAGFMWRISSAVNYELFGGEKSRKRAYMAALAVAARFNPAGNFIRAFNSEGTEGRVIIDTLMNLPLLYWASRQINDPRFKNIAMKHADTVMQTHLRADGSVQHIMMFDAETGEIVRRAKGAAASPDGAWSRGQGWAIYGFTLSYIYTGKVEYLDAAKRAANYFISEVSSNNWLPKTDFRAPSPSCDTTAGAIAACGLIEIAKVVPEEEKHLYITSALNILRVLEENYCDWTDEEQSILQHGVESYTEERLKGRSIIYGDYYFAEAIYKLKGFEPLFW